MESIQEGSEYYNLQYKKRKQNRSPQIRHRREALKQISSLFYRSSSSNALPFFFLQTAPHKKASKLHYLYDA